MPSGGAERPVDAGDVVAAGGVAGEAQAEAASGRSVFGGRIEIAFVLDDRDVADVGGVARPPARRRRGVRVGLAERPRRVVTPPRDASTGRRGRAIAGCRRGRSSCSSRAGGDVGGEEPGFSLRLRLARPRTDLSVWAAASGWRRGAARIRRRRISSSPRRRRGEESLHRRLLLGCHLLEDLLRVGRFLRRRRERHELLEVGLGLVQLAGRRGRRGRGSSRSRSGSGTAPAAWSASATASAPFFSLISVIAAFMKGNGSFTFVMSTPSRIALAPALSPALHQQVRVQELQVDVVRLLLDRDLQVLERLGRLALGRVGARDEPFELVDRAGTSRAGPRRSCGRRRTSRPARARPLSGPVR